ncbi:MAG: amino acid adenylation domain-containing protein [Hydrogenophaga sp.]|uniref:non-ribosomal peptide synthetase/type I polyketide synthase n=1 Tax=Hydrogenophaga sp. TaxID=1904254 RepID=UPI001D5600C1|nr:non-ribosomal peptide synthetase/type I polyketide synthase [Hydrogenophaga sp.]MBX3611483.1 amino acid adenylation domain-containing protein [Hydrogenophaga sp.]
MRTRKQGSVSADEAPRLGDWLVRGATEWGSQVAIDSVIEGQLTYAQLLRQVEAEAAQWTAAGVQPGERVAIAASRSTASVVSILVAAHLRVAYVPLDLSYPAERLQAMLEDAAPRAVVGAPDALAALRAQVPVLPTLDNPAPAEQGLHAATPDLAYVLFTSGSTGRPKGVAMGDLPLRHLIHWHARHPRLGLAARTLQFAPLSFDVHFQEIFSTLACGGTLVLVPEAQRRDPAQLHRLLLAQRVERIFVPYVALQMIADASRDEAPCALREVISAGEQLQVSPAIRSMFERLPQAQLHNHYGPTESHVVTAHELTGAASGWPEIPPIGLPLPHVRVALRETEQMDGGATQGELLLGGDTLANGYLGRAELSAERFRTDIADLPGRWYVTGDLVRQAADGTLTYLGRADQQVKVDGFRIEPGEIEIALMAHPTVKEAVVTAPDVPGIGKQLVAHVVLHEPLSDEGTRKLSAQWRPFLRARMPEYMVPLRYVVLPRLPVTPSGKIDRRNLPLPEVALSHGDASDPRALVHQVWSELLGVEHIDEQHNLFELGAKSLLVMRFIARLRDAGVQRIGVADVYDKPTIAGILSRLDDSVATAKRQTRRGQASATNGIAIVGMATRVPGAGDVDTFWSALLQGKEGIRHFSPSELDPAVPTDWRQRPNFVAAHGVLDDADRFDAAHFGVSAREATVLDPQQRLMLELSITALEHAGIDHTRSASRIGVYAGTGNNAYAHALRQEQPELIQQYGEFATMLASEKDYVATRIANRLNLKGPAISIHTACSTSLVAVAQAWHALASDQCDIALAGGANVHVPQATGYLHVEGGMESADGHCRPFDADASGTVFGSGGGMVVLKRIEDALADGDTIYAVIKGVGVNNDGGDKASFTAPSVSGQADAIRMALDHAGIDARSIGYVEAHGTGTSLGDPIEIAALSQAWRGDTGDNAFCTIGSVKGNVGHLAAGAGVVGLIKATLALQHGTIPGTLHFQHANPQIDFAHSPFRVTADNTPWADTADSPRRAAVSSLGVGGTNAHVIIEQAPALADVVKPQESARWVLPLSARTADELSGRAEQLASHLQQHPGTPIASVAATLMRGRREMGQRASVVAETVEEAIQALRSIKTATAAKTPRLVFLYPGQGSQHPGMARGLYDSSVAFRDALDACLTRVLQRTGVDLLPWLVHAEPGDAQAASQLALTQHTQPALFAMSYALTAWLDSLGVQADAAIGHSIGEYAAACHAGVFELDGAVEAVIARATAMAEQPTGAMLAVRLGADVLRPRLPPEVEIAGCNAPALTVVAGPFAAIEAFAVTLEAQEVDCTRLKVSHAFHSAAMQGALPRIAAAIDQCTRRAPQRTVYSCVSGAPLTAAEALDADYWARQVRAPVMFSKAIETELAKGDVLFLEVGPGQALSALVRQHRTAQAKVPNNLALLGPANAPGDAERHALTALGALWSHGVRVRWPVAASAPRATLPTYPFKRDRHWFARRAPQAPALSTLSSDTSAAIAVPVSSPEPSLPMSRLPNLEAELQRIVSDVSGVPAAELTRDASFVDQGLDSLSLTQATLEIERVFGLKLRFRRLLEDLDTIGKLAGLLDTELPPDRFAPAPAVAPAAVPTAAAAMPAPTQALAIPAVATAMAAPAGSALQQLIQQQMQLMSQQLALLAGAPQIPVAPMAPVQVAPTQTAAVAPAPTSAPAAATGASAPTGASEPDIKSLVEKPFGASPRLTLQAGQDFTPEQHRWIDDFIARYNARTGKSKAFSQDNRKVMADPRVVTGFNPMWKDLVYPIVVDRSKGASLWDIDGNEYIDLLSCFGANMLGYQPDDVLQAMHRQLDLGLEVGPQHPLSADVARLIAEFTGMERVAFCNTGSEAVMGAMRIARTVTGRKKIAIFNNSYHGIFDEVIVRGTKQLRSLSAAPGILANAVENILVLDWDSEESLRILREQGPQLAAIMTEPIQNKYPNVRPKAFVQALRDIATQSGCALIFDEVVTGFRVARGGAQEFYGVRADIATFGKVIGGGLPFAAISGASHWLDALDGGHWQYGDDSYPEAGVTYFAGTFVRHPLALAAAHASLLHIQRAGAAFYDTINQRAQRLVDRLNAGFTRLGAPCNAVNCTSIWRLHWDDGLKNVSLFYYLIRHLGLHVYEQFGHFVTEAMDDAVIDRIADTMLKALDELMGLGFIPRRDGGAPGGGRKPDAAEPQTQALSATQPTEGALSPGQTERWLVAAFDDAARRALNESFCVSVRGDVNKAALRQALQDVAMRHDAFQLTFDTTEPLQRVRPAQPVVIAEVDLRHEDDAEAALDAFCTQASQRDFQLDQAPLAAFSLIDLADGRVVVHVVASHLIFDGWASSVFNTELAEAYQARRQGHAPRFAKTAESPVAFALVEQARMSGAQGQEALDFWKEALRNAPAPVNLGDRQPQGRRRFIADTVRVRIDGQRFAMLRERAKAKRATLFQWLLAAITRLIHTESGQGDFVVSIPYASQSLDRHGPLMADGVLDLPLRLACTAQDTDETLLTLVRSRLMDALEYPVMTQGTLARALGMPSRGDRPPLTGIYFNLNPKVDLSGYLPLQASMHEGRKQGLLAELFFNFYEQGDALTLDLHHSAEFFSPARAQALVDGLLQEIDRLNGAPTTAKAQAAVPQPDTTGSAGTKGAAADPRIVAWNRATDVPFDVSTRVEASIAQQALRTPNAEAVVAQGVRLTYAQLEQRANQFGHLLAQRGVGPGALVGVCMARGPELVPTLLGILKTGAAYVPLDPGFPKDRLDYMAEDAGLRLIVTEAANAALGGLPRDQQIRIDDDRAAIDAAPNHPLPAPINPDGDAPMYVIYTSGSTGKPKGVVVPQRAVSNFLATMQSEPGLQASDRLLAVTTLSFDIAVLELYLPLITGACTVLAQRDEVMDGEVLGRLMLEHRITVMQATPTTWHMLLDAGWQASADLRALCGGEPLPPSLAAKLLTSGVELWNMYGPTETTVWSTLCRITDPRQKITIGHPIANTQVWVLDEQGKPCAIGQEGELCIGGTGVANGYFKRPELTAERFVPDPYHQQPGARMYRTGDLARWLDDGSLEHLGRLDFQVKIRGYRIELGEIEARLAALPGIARTVAMAREDTPGDVRLIAYAVAATGATPDPQALREALRGGLPDYMLPQQVVLLDAMPLLPNGKIDRKALPVPTSQAPAANGPLKAASSETERAVMAAMQAVLNLPAIGADENFFAMGGHSLLAAKLMGQLNKSLGLQLNLRVLFESPTVEKLASAIDAQRGGKTPQRAPLTHQPERRQAPLTLMQERIRFIEEMHPGRVVYNVPSAHRLRGPMNAEVFDAAFQAMVRRQASLRTIVVRDGNAWVQRTLDQVPCSLLPIEDLSHVPAAQREEAMSDLVASWVAQPFQLDQAPLFRARLIRLEEDHHIFFFMTHHVVWDGWSFDLLYENLSALYTAKLEGREADLPAMPLQYLDFAAWHNEWMQSEEIAAQLDHWQKPFLKRPVPAPLTDLPRLPGAQREGATEYMHLEPADAERVREVAKQTGATLSIVAFAVYAVLASQLLHDPEPTIGVPVRGRPHPDLEPIMGFFNNMLPVRLSVRHDLTWLDWIKQVRATMVDAFANQDVPFERLSEALETAQPGQHGRLYQALFTFQDARARPANWGPLTHERTKFKHRGATEDLNFWLVEIPTGIEGGIQYDTQLFLPSTARLLHKRFMATLMALADKPTQRIADTIALGADETARLQALDAPALNGQDPFKALGRDDCSTRLRANGEWLDAAGIRARMASAEARLDQGNGAVTVPGPATADALLTMLAALQTGRGVQLQAGGVVDAGRWRNTVEALAQQVQLLPGDRMLAYGGQPGFLLCLMGLALRQGVELSLLDAGAAIDPTRVSELRADDTALVFADANTWGALLDANEGRALSLIAALDVRETTPMLSQRLADTPTSALHLALDPSTGLVVAAGWANGAGDHDTFGRPLVRDTVHIGEQADQLAAIGVPAPLWLRDSQGAWRNAGVLARWRADGVLQFLGELDGHATLHGQRLSLGEIAADLTQLPLMQRAATTVQVQPDGTRRLIVGIEPDSNVQEGGLTALLQRVQQRLTQWVPDNLRASVDVLCFDRLATTADGRLAIAASRLRRQASVTDSANDFQGSATEREIFLVWRDLLGTAAIRRNDNFFDLGGTSLTAMQAVQKLEQKIGKQVSPRRYVSETLAQLAAAYDGQAHTSAATASEPAASTPTSAGGIMNRLRRLVQRA